MKLRARVAGALTFILAVSSFAAFGAEDRFALELSYGTLDGPGEELGTPRDRRVRDIESATARGLRFSWSFAEQWRLNGSYGRTTARYANIESVACSLDAGIVNSLFGNTCIDLDDRSAGSFQDRIEDSRLTVSRYWPLGTSIRIETELGLHHSSWRAPDDREARLVATCQSVGDLRRLPQGARPVPGCRPVAVGSSDTAPWAAVVAHVGDGHGWTASAGVHYQGQRHRIYRSDVLDRSRQANCPNVLAPICRPLLSADRYAARIPRSSWVWYSVRLGHRMTDEIEVFGEWVGGGTRDWNGGQVGLVFRF